MSKFHIKLFLLVGFCFFAPLFSEDDVQKCFSRKFKALTYPGSEDELTKNIHAAMDDCGAGFRFSVVRVFSQFPEVLAAAVSVNDGPGLERVFGSPVSSQDQEEIKKFFAKERQLAEGKRKKEEEGSSSIFFNLVYCDR